MIFGTQPNNQIVGFLQIHSWLRLIIVDYLHVKMITKWCIIGNKIEKKSEKDRERDA